MHSASVALGLSIVLGSSALLASGTSVLAQCSSQWRGCGFLGGSVGSLVVLPGDDVVVGGSFINVGSPNTVLVARWNGLSWSGLGAGNPGHTTGIHALAVLHSGEIVAGGPAPGGSDQWVFVVRWNGSTWSSVGPAFYWLTWPIQLAGIGALAVLPNGDLVAGGGFTSVGGVNISNIARWDGSTWSPLGAGTNGHVVALEVLPNGDLVAGGVFTSAGGVTASVARWDGTSWSAMGGVFNDEVRALAVLPNGDLVAAGWFTSAGGIAADHIARWDGSTWSPLGTGTNGYVFALAKLPDGDLVAGGNFTAAGGRPALGVASWDGQSWSALAGGVPVAGGVLISALATRNNGDLVAGGSFVAAPGGSDINIAVWSMPSADFNHDGSPGTNADIEAFFACLGGACCPTCGSADFNGDGDIGTDADIEAFFRVLAGGTC